MAAADDKPKNKRQEARAKTVEQLLEAGQELVSEAVETGAADPLRFLSPSDITERASAFRKQKLSHGMLYHLWQPIAGIADPLAAYRRDLLIRILDLPFDPGAVQREALKRMQQAKDEGRRLELDELIRVVGEFEFRRYAHEGTRARKIRFSTLMLVFAEITLMSVDEGARGELRDKMVEDMRERGSYAKLVGTYRNLLGALGLEMAEGFRVEDLVEGLWAMLDGFTLNSWHFQRVIEERTWRGQTGWSLFSIAAYLFVDALTVEVR
jgi:hypothetical protein